VKVIGDEENAGEMIGDEREEMQPAPCRVLISPGDSLSDGAGIDLEIERGYWQNSAVSRFIG
jgi:hypothetical protein